MPIAAEIDTVYKERVRAVLGGRSVTEAELRRLFEEGQACALILRGQLEKSERVLDALSSDPESSFVELAAAIRRVNELRPELEDLEEIVGELDARAREFRTSWLTGRA